MIDPDEWQAVKHITNAAFATSMHMSIASVTAEGLPVVTPIGSILLAEPGRAIYFEVLAAGLGKRLQHQPDFSLLAVDSGMLRWARSLRRGTSTRPLAIRLVGRANPETRLATPAEAARWRQRIRWVWSWKGSQALWGREQRVRDLRIDRIEPIRVLPVVP